MFEDQEEESQCETRVDLTVLEDSYEVMIKNLYWCNLYNLNVQCFKNLIRDLEIEKFK